MKASAAPASLAEGISVLVVDVVSEARDFLASSLAADPQVRTVHSVGDAEAALDFLGKRGADVVLMGHRLPLLDGFEATRRIMETLARPIVLCADATAADAVFRSLEAGAVACVEKPGPGDGAAVAHLLQTVKLMSEVRVVRRWTTAPRREAPPAPTPTPTPDSSLRVVGIGASTGGPPVLQTILARLPNDFALPVLVVQHIANGFLPGMADWLRQTSGLKVQIAAYGMQVLPGHVYLAPDDFQMGLSAEGRIVLSRPTADQSLCPSVDCLFSSLAEACGHRAIGVLLTGMGKDGAIELKHLRDLGAVTLAQDQASSVVHGMPGEAIALGAALHVMTPEQIADQLVKLAQQRHVTLPRAAR